ncbi:unnamed protein product [Prorocentrum cordatum]|uniref:Uncharacterized protein n=1 Tax=Prorocentrum cordatum TaxID=2364126 RepID=A0ABN9UUX3_9DINO|nr:unnamed protein product [Polarella glacialis]
MKHTLRSKKCEEDAMKENIDMIVRTIKTVHGPWDDHVLMLGHPGAGRIAKMKVYDPDCIVHRVSKYTDFGFPILPTSGITIGCQDHRYMFHARRGRKPIR